VSPLVQLESVESIEEKAAAWVVRLHSEPSPADLARLAQWREQSEDHERAFEAALAAWVSIDDHAAAAPILAMRRDTLQRAHRRRRRWQLPRVAAMVLGACIAPLLVWFAMRSPPPEGYTTALGEQRVIVLPDGTRMSLDARSQVAVSYGKDLRAIQLIAGRANFEVTKDLTRPLKVKVGERSVTATGTIFTVEREPRDLVVTLLEGSVAVSAGIANEMPIEMLAGQELTLTDSGQAEVRAGIDPGLALAWREGKLVFDNEPLERVVARMNNYVSTPITVQADIANLPISGVFKAGDTEAFIGAVKVYFAIEETRTAHGIHLKKRPTPLH
jgi:transmembrane sensor